jgi:uncharacterized protein (DUF2147 family)
MLKNMFALKKNPWLFLLLFLPISLLSACSTTGSTPTSPTVTAIASQAPALATTVVSQAPALATAAAQAIYESYVGKWEVHDAVLTINAGETGLDQWNAGPCGNTMCGGNAHIIFTVNTDGSLKGTIQSVDYTQANGNPPPSGFQPDTADDPQMGYTFQLQRNDVHLLYITWLGSANSLNSGNRYWCGTGASQTDMAKCGA